MSVQTEVCINYDTHDSLRGFISAQFLKSDTTDVEVLVTSVDRPEESLKAFRLHRFILNQTTFFRPLMRNDNSWLRESCKIALVDENFNITLEVVELAFKLLYADNFPDFGEEILANVFPLFHLSNQIGFDRLKKYCELSIAAGINSSNVLDCLNYCTVNEGMEKTLIYTAVIQWIKLFFFYNGMGCEENIKMFSDDALEDLYESPELNCYGGKQYFFKMFKDRISAQGPPRESNCLTYKWYFRRKENLPTPNRDWGYQDPLTVFMNESFQMHGCDWKIYTIYNHRTGNLKLTLYATLEEKKAKKKTAKFFVKTTFYFVHREGTEELQNEGTIIVNKKRIDLGSVNSECLKKAFVTDDNLLVNGIVLKIKIKPK